MLKKWFLLLIVSILLTGCTSWLEKSPKESVQDQLGIEMDKETDKNIDLVKYPFSLGKDERNFLLVGVDSRGEKESRSDAILLVRYEPSNNMIKLVSLMRDSYVKIPEYPYTYSKLNHSYYLGGKELLKETVEENFDVEIDHIAVIDFKGFIKVFDTIAPDGIEVNVTQTMIEDMKLELDPGMQKLHGENLLSYVRFRHDGESDFGRVERQQEVLISLKDQIMNQFRTVGGLAHFPEIIKQAMTHIDTDLKIDEVFALGTTFLLNPATDIETLRVPVANSFENKHYEHTGSVLQLNFQENTEALKQFLNAEKK